MGTGDQAGGRGLRVIAHLAIVVVFVLSALGYAPVREPSAAVAAVVADASRTVQKIDGACGTPTPAITIRDASAKSADAATTSRDCQRPERQLAAVRNKRDLSGGPPDLRRAH